MALAISKDSIVLVLVEVPDMVKEGALDEAVKGVSVVAHVIFNTSLDFHPDIVIPEVLAGVNNVLKAAASSLSVKRFIFTFTSTAETKPYPKKKFDVTTDSWNDKDAWAPPPFGPERTGVVDDASKAVAEKTAWNSMKEQKLKFICNTILPASNFGMSCLMDVSHRLLGKYNCGSMKAPASHGLDL